MVEVCPFNGKGYKGRLPNRDEPCPVCKKLADGTWPHPTPPGARECVDTIMDTSELDRLRAENERLREACEQMTRAGEKAGEIMAEGANERAQLKARITALEAALRELSIPKVLGPGTPFAMKERDPAHVELRARMDFAARTLGDHDGS